MPCKIGTRVNNKLDRMYMPQCYTVPSNHANTDGGLMHWVAAAAIGVFAILNSFLIG